MKNKIPKEIGDHYQRVVDMGCIVTESPICIIHHCMGGSMVSEFGLKSQSQKLNDWLVIPLHPSLHTNGDQAIHRMPIKDWENTFYSQMYLLRLVNVRLKQLGFGYDIFQKARLENARTSKIFRR